MKNAFTHSRVQWMDFVQFHINEVLRKASDAPPPLAAILSVSNKLI